MMYYLRDRRVQLILAAMIAIGALLVMAECAGPTGSSYLGAGRLVAPNAHAAAHSRHFTPARWGSNPPGPVA